MPYTTLSGEVRYEERVKGSRFLAIAAATLDAEAARAYVRDQRTSFEDASHVCSAWRVERDMAFDDDGEPGGTAGRPMLEVLLKRNLDHVVVICVRWFGGTKLGAGGLVRAYGGTVAKALDLAHVITVHETEQVCIQVPFAQLDTVHRLLGERADVVRHAPVYHPDRVELPLTIRADQRDDLAVAIREATSASAVLRNADAASSPG